MRTRFETEAQGYLNVIHQYCICASLLRIILRVINARIKRAAFSLRLDLAIDLNRHFLKNEYGDLLFFPMF